MANRYRLTLAVEFSAGDDPGARQVVTRNMDTLTAVAADLRGCVLIGAVCVGTPVKVKLQRLNDDAPPRALVVETL
jgi:hypothetical protein